MIYSGFMGKEQVMFLKDGTFCLMFGNEYGLTEVRFIDAILKFKKIFGLFVFAA